MFFLKLIFLAVPIALARPNACAAPCRWRGTGLTWRGVAGGALAWPVLPCHPSWRGSAAPCYVARLDQTYHTSTHTCRCACRSSGLPGWLNQNASRLYFVEFFSRPNREFDKPMISFSSFIIRLTTMLTNRLRKIESD